MNSPSEYVPNRLLEISGEITTERMKRHSQSKNNTQLCLNAIRYSGRDRLRRLALEGIDLVVKVCEAKLQYIHTGHISCWLSENWQVT